MQPEDSYGFIPTKVDEGATAFFLYRDRPEYEAARPKLAAPEEATHLGPIRIEPTQRVEMGVEGGARAARTAVASTSGTTIGSPTAIGPSTTPRAMPTPLRPTRRVAGRTR
jgi:hypothetical protein